MLPLHGDNAAASEMSCADLRSESDRTSLKILPAKKRMVDLKPWRDYGLLDKQVKIKALYDTLRGQLLSDGNVSCDRKAVSKMISFVHVKENLEIQDLGGPLKLYECWSCCNSKCCRGADTKKARSHRRRHGSWFVVSSSGTDSNRSSANKIHFSAKLVKSEPCTFKFRSLIKDQSTVFSGCKSIEHTHFTLTEDRFLCSRSARKQKKVCVYYKNFKGYESCDGSISGNTFYPLEMAQQHTLRENGKADRELNPNGQNEIVNSECNLDYTQCNKMIDLTHITKHNFVEKQDNNFGKHLFACNPLEGLNKLQFSRGRSKMKMNEYEACPFYKTSNYKNISSGVNSACENSQVIESYSLLKDTKNKLSKRNPTRATYKSFHTSKSSIHGVQKQKYFNNCNVIRIKIPTYPKQVAAKHAKIIRNSFIKSFLYKRLKSKLRKCFSRVKPKNLITTCEQRSYSDFPHKQKPLKFIRKIHNKEAPHSQEKLKINNFETKQQPKRPFSFNNNNLALFKKTSPTNPQKISLLIKIGKRGNSMKNDSAAKRCSCTLKFQKNKRNSAAKHVDYVRTHDGDIENVTEHFNDKCKVFKPASVSVQMFKNVCPSDALQVVPQIIEIPKSIKNYKMMKSTEKMRNIVLENPQLKRCFCTSMKEDLQTKEITNLFNPFKYPLNLYAMTRVVIASTKINGPTKPLPHNAEWLSSNRYSCCEMNASKSNQQHLNEHSSSFSLFSSFENRPRAMPLLSQKTNLADTSCKRLLVMSTINVSSRNIRLESSYSFRVNRYQKHMPIMGNDSQLENNNVILPKHMAGLTSRIREIQSSVSRLTSINPFFKRCYCTMNTQVSGRKSRLKSYECEPGICVPTECGPTECQKLIMKRFMEKEDKCKKRVKPRPIVKKSSGTGAVRVGSSLSFDVVFSKENFGSSKKKPDVCNTLPKRDRRKSKRSDRDCHSDVQKFRSRGSGTTMNRCCCTLKLQKMGKQQISHNVSVDQGTSTPTKTIVSTDVHASQNTKSSKKEKQLKLLPYECEPGICVPEECNPTDCLEFIHKRQRKSKGTSSNKSSVNSSSSKLKSGKCRKPAKSKLRSEKFLENPSRQVVRLGSSLSFNIEFYKDKSPPYVKTKSAKICKQDKILASKKRTKTCPSQDSHSTRYRDSQMSSSKKPKSTITGSPIKRCFCTSKLQNGGAGESVVYSKNTKIPALENREPSKKTTTQGTATPATRVSPTMRSKSVMVASKNKTDSYKLSPYECEPKICVPGSCDPYECEKRIKTKKVPKHVESCDTVSTPSRQAVRIGSTFSFNIEFYKDRSPDGIKLSSKPTKKSPKKVKKSSCATRGRQVTSKNQPSTSTGVASLIKKCFCTLKLQKTENKENSEQKSVAIETVKVIGEPEIHAVDTGTSTKSKYMELKSYECELGVCIPGQCDPNECLKRIKEREVRSKRPSSIKSKARSGSSFKSGSAKSKTQKIRSERDGQSKLSRGDGKSTNKRLFDEYSPTRQAVRIGSSFSFNIEFYKDHSPQVPYSPVWSPESKSICEQSKKKSKKQPIESNFSEGVNQESPSQAKETKTESKASGAGTVLKRCFCTLKLQKNGHQQRVDQGIDFTQKDISTATRATNRVETVTIAGKEVGTETKKIPYNLEPYECEPGVCIPGTCDPYQCLERIKQRNLTNNSVRTSVRSTSKSATKSKRASSIKTQGSLKTKNIDEQRPRSSRAVENFNRQAVRIGSSFNFDIECYKDRKAPCDKPPQDNRPSCLQRKSAKSNTKSKNTGKCEKSQAVRVATQSKASAAEPLLKRCFCTLTLQRASIHYTNKTEITKIIKQNIFKKHMNKYFQSGISSMGKYISLEADTKYLSKYKQDTSIQQSISLDRFDPLSPVEDKIQQDIRSGQVSLKQFEIEQFISKLVPTNHPLPTNRTYNNSAKAFMNGGVRLTTIKNNNDANKIYNKSRSLGILLKCCFRTPDKNVVPFHFQKTTYFGQVSQTTPNQFNQNICVQKHYHQRLFSSIKLNTNRKIAPCCKTANTKRQDTKLSPLVETILPYSPTKFKTTENVIGNNMIKNKSMAKRQVTIHCYERHNLNIVKGDPINKKGIGNTIEILKQRKYESQTFYKRFINCCSQVFSKQNYALRAKDTKPVTMNKPAYKLTAEVLKLKPSKTKLRSKFVELNKLSKLHNVPKLTTNLSNDKHYNCGRKTILRGAGDDNIINPVKPTLKCPKDEIRQKNVYVSNRIYKKKHINFSNFLNNYAKSSKTSASNVNNSPCVCICDCYKIYNMNNVRLNSKTRIQLNNSKELNKKDDYRTLLRNTNLSRNITKDLSQKDVNLFQRQSFFVNFASLRHKTKLGVPKSCKCVRPCPCTKLKKPKTRILVEKCNCCVCSANKSGTKKNQKKKENQKSEINKCTCGSTICSNEFEKLVKSKRMKKQPSDKPEPCVCGSKVCKSEAKRISLHLKKFKGEIKTTFLSMCGCVSKN